MENGNCFGGFLPKSKECLNCKVKNSCMRERKNDKMNERRKFL